MAGFKRKNKSNKISI